MKIIREPSIYLVGRQEISQDALAQFMADNDTSWETDTEIGAEQISELSGRLCFDEATEILTDEGWKRFYELKRTEKVLTLNPNTGYTEYQKPSAYHQYNYSGMLKYYEGQNISFAVTPEHRQYGHFPGKQDEFITTAEIGKRQFMIKTAGLGWEGSYPAFIGFPSRAFVQRVANQFSSSYGIRATLTKPRFIDEQAQIHALALLLTYFVTEGSIRHQPGTGQGIVIYGDHETGVKKCCDILNLPMTTYKDQRNNVLRFLIGGGQTLRAFVEEQCGHGAQNKKFPQWVLNLPTETLREIWNLLVETDGHHYPSGREVLITTSPTLAGQAQEILCKLGYSSAIRPESKGVNYPVYRVSRKLGRDAHLNHHTYIEERPYEGKVYCVTTQNEVVYIRRNGKPHFSGNCYMSFGKNQGRKTNHDYLENILKQEHGSVLEHAVWNFIITGVSRSFSHELVRHRAGVAISQLSQRYVDESDVDFVEPAVIADDPEMHTIWETSMQQAHTAYLALADRLATRIEAEHPGLSKRERRKMAREAARSVLPNATETKIAFSANTRALRHIIELRGAAGTEPEIRRFSVKMLRLMQAQAPNLFGDMEVVTLPDGSEGVNATYHKV